MRYSRVADKMFLRREVLFVPRIKMHPRRLIKISFAFNRDPTSRRSVKTRKSGKFVRVASSRSKGSALKLSRPCYNNLT